MRLGAILSALLTFGALAACGGTPPQIVDYSPERGAKDVSTAAPIRITFDHDVDQPSVQSRLFLLPATQADLRWLSPRQLVYEHATLQTSTTYEVVLEAGYKDPAGNTYTLRHHWSFVTEGPPSLAGSSPADKETGVDPSSYLALDFTRVMDPATLKSAITISPSVPFTVRLDPTDARRAIVAPDTLLDPATTYDLSVNTGALDADGNQLDRDQSLVFTTGAVRPLHHWVAFATTLGDGSSAGVWIVNEAGFPRQLFAGSTVHSFSWSPDGTTLLVQGDGLSWYAFTPGSGSSPLAFRATWAAALSTGLGYVYLDTSGSLHRWSAGGADEVIADAVSEAAVAPGGQRVAFVLTSGLASTIWGYDVGLRARYQLANEATTVSDLSWSPSGNRIAYLREDSGAITLRVRNLAGQATTTTVASGDIGHPSWLPDSTHLVFAASVETPTGPARKAFLVSAVAPPAALTAALGQPAGLGDVTDPMPSPDGHQIAFVSANQVWIMNADGTRPTALTRFDVQAFPYSCRMPIWTRT